jgi:hypothetical protein
MGKKEKKGKEINKETKQEGKKRRLVGLGVFDSTLLHSGCGLGVGGV